MSPTDPEADTALTLAAELRLQLGGQALAGTRRLALLAEIGRLGSITHAARAVGLSYKGAWAAVEDMSNLAGEPLVSRSAGGKGGGHADLTARGAELVRNFALIEREHARFVERLNAQAQGLSRDYTWVESIAMRTSARNQFAGTVSAVRTGAVNDEITLDIIGGQQIVATVTSDSRAELGLDVGAKAFALVKASSIIVMTEAEGARLSARNQLRGTVERVVTGAVNSEVVIALDGGGTVAAVVTNESATALALAEGVSASAVFKASSVIVGVTA
jgi:molybdate transport system regulatory protein